MSEQAAPAADPRATSPGAIAPPASTTSPTPTAGAASDDASAAARARRVDPLGVALMVVVHLGALAALVVGVSPVAVAVAAVAYLVRMFGITGWFHRYFSHRSFKTSRAMQFLFALITTTSVQRGPLWWAAHHRGHHAHTDEPEDVHSPRQYGFVWSHIGWFLAPENLTTREERIQDFLRFPELRWLNRNDLLVSVLFAVSMWLLGLVLEHTAPGLGTTSWQMLVWGFFVSTTLLYHATYSVNSICHLFGRRRYDTPEDSRNNFLVALFTLGEGWHNNHHRFPRSARQGLRWWEIDLTFYALWLMQRVGLIWDLKPPPADALSQRISRPARAAR